MSTSRVTFISVSRMEPGVSGSGGRMGLGERDQI